MWLYKEGLRWALTRSYDSVLVRQSSFRALRRKPGNMEKGAVPRVPLDK